MSDAELREKVKKWLNAQGFPLEFSTAAAFRDAGFRTRQGIYVADPKTGTFREIDVLAWLEYETTERRYEVSFVVECKWSRDKPWLVFASGRGQAAASEQIAYMVGSRLGEAVLWNLVADPSLRLLGLFNPSHPLGFSGRQALTDKQDLFYSAVQSVVAASVSHATALDGDPVVITETMRVVRLVIPLIVVDGLVYQTSFSNGELDLEAVADARLQWRGSDLRQPPCFVHIATADGLAKYLDTMANNVPILLYRLEAAAKAVDLAINQSSWAPMAFDPLAAKDLIIPSLLLAALGDPRIVA